jgi:hypothetical protein
MDKVTSLSVIKVPDSAGFFAFIFGQKVVSIVQVGGGPEPKYFGSKTFTNVVTAVLRVSEGTIAPGKFEVKFFLAFSNGD